MGETNFKSGFVSIVGRPNVGKSTLLNQILQEKVAIVSPKAQTTRNQIQGIYTTDDEQIIFIDTPGIHKAHNTLGNLMNEYALKALGGVDLVLFLIDASHAKTKDDDEILASLNNLKIPVILVCNKVDLVKDELVLKKHIDSYRESGNFINGLVISATNNYQIDQLIKMINNYLPIGPMYYPKDQLMVEPERFLVAEIIREKVLLNTLEEVPHSTAIMIQSFKENQNKIEILADIIVERDSQKKIIIGAKGAMIKKIGTEARKEITKILDAQVYLELFVRVEKDWRNKGKKLNELGYRHLDL